MNICVCVCVCMCVCMSHHTKRIRNSNKRVLMLRIGEYLQNQNVQRLSAKRNFFVGSLKKMSRHCEKVPKKSRNFENFQNSNFTLEIFNFGKMILEREEK